jgi:LCP family protein required for cell wall assembly
MEEKKFTSFREKRQENVVPLKRKITKKWWVVGGLSVLGLALISLFLWWRSETGVVGFNFPGKVQEELKDGRITVLLLGNAGGSHDGATLTDSIIVASFDPETKKAVLISIPRDLWINDIEEKVNAVYQAGLKKEGGLQFAKEEIGKVVGIPIDYALRLDFGGFVKAIDLVGGVDVDIPNTFDDYNYPIEGKEDDLCGNVDQEIELTPEQAAVLKVEPGKRRVLVTPSGNVATTSADFACRYEHVHFVKGVSHMNGAEALVFVRSRMGTNGEGSDFARSRRQQRVIEAFRTKVLSMETLLNPQKVFGLLETFGKSFETDIPTSKFLDMYKQSKNVETTESIVLGQLGNGKSLFINPPVGQYGAWVLIPPDNDFSGVIDLVRQTLEGSVSGQLASPSPAR